MVGRTPVSALKANVSCESIEAPEAWPVTVRLPPIRWPMRLPSGWAENPDLPAAVAQPVEGEQTALVGVHHPRRRPREPGSFDAVRLGIAARPRLRLGE